MGRATGNETFYGDGLSVKSKPNQLDYSISLKLW